jgi:hypothetical protein
MRHCGVFERTPVPGSKASRTNNTRRTLKRISDSSTSYVAVQYFPASHLRDYEHAEHSKWHRHGNEKIASHYRLRVIADERLPRLRRCPWAAPIRVRRPVRPQRSWRDVDPCFRDNSEATRPCPHVKFSLAISAINSRMFRGRRGLPGFDFQRQNSWNPRRCHRIRVCGRTMANACFQSNQRDQNTSVILAASVSQCGFVSCS